MNWELSVLHWFESLHNPVLDPVMKGLTFLGNAGCFWIALAVVLLFFKRTRKIGITMAVSLVLSLIFTNLIIKNLVNRTRPFEADPAFFTDDACKTAFGFVISFGTYLSKCCCSRCHIHPEQKMGYSGSRACRAYRSFKIISYRTFSYRRYCRSLTRYYIWNRCILYHIKINL